MMIIGIDVSKAKLDCLWLKDSARNKVKTRVVPNTPKGFVTLLDWAVKQTQEPVATVHFIMEATGVYHEALAYALHEAGARVSVVNPARIHDYGKSLGVRSKTDKKDSYVIARYGATQHPALWQPEPRAIRQLKALIARLNAVEKDVQRERNRLEKAEISQSSAAVITSINTVLTQLETEQKRLEVLINDHIDQHPDLKQDRALLESIPGVGPVISRMMVAILRSRAFDSASQSAAYLGLVPKHHESGSSVRGRSRLTKAGDATIRAKLYMAAVVSTQHNPDIKQQYERLLKNGKAKMSALCAAMRKLVHICFGVLKHQQPYQPQCL
ncbi:MAG: IS110-like element IS1663 family transposase [Gammaproteobacteria bacterium]|nr:MAG: IS110-like element IS1663 family transposase [Gammaproteobacteria bacterium]